MYRGILDPLTAPWNALGPRVVAVARYHERDGIGRYADQLAAAYADGREFVRVGIREGPGDWHRDFHRGLRALWLLRDARRGDDVLVHYHPHYYLRGGTWSRAATYASFAVAASLREFTVVVHEPDPARGGVEGVVARRWWRTPRRLVFHSERERDRHLERFGRGRRQELVVVAHGEFFTSRIAADRGEARARLGLPGDRAIVLMIGFLSGSDPDKGYDRAIAAVNAAADPQLELHIVGSPIREDAETEVLIADLRAAAAASAQVTLHEQYVDDDAFDLWIRAADAVLTPYRSSSSSGVVARAHLLGTPVITSDVGGLVEQAGPDDTVVHDDAELLAAVRRVAQARRSSSSR